MTCDHGLTFDPKAARGMTVEEVRQRWPRLDGPCPKGCGFSGRKYANPDHFVAGGWAEIRHVFGQ